jgi:hypothetical protein
MAWPTAPFDTTTLVTADQVNDLDDDLGGTGGSLKKHSTQHGQIKTRIETLEAKLGEVLDSTPYGPFATVDARLEALEAIVDAGLGGGGPFLPLAGGTMTGDIVSDSAFDVDGGTVVDKAWMRLFQGGDLNTADQVDWSGGAGPWYRPANHETGTPLLLKRAYTINQAEVSMTGPQIIQVPFPTAMQAGSGFMGAIELDTQLTYDADHGPSAAPGIEQWTVHKNTNSVAGVSFGITQPWVSLTIYAADHQTATIDPSVDVGIFGVAVQGLYHQAIFRSVNTSGAGADGTMDASVNWDVGAFFRNSTMVPNGAASSKAQLLGRVATWQTAASDGLIASSTWDPGEIEYSYGHVVEPETDIAGLVTQTPFLFGKPNYATGALDSYRFYVGREGNVYCQTTDALVTPLVAAGLNDGVPGKITMRHTPTGGLVTTAANVEFARIGGVTSDASTYPANARFSWVTTEAHNYLGGGNPHGAMIQVWTVEDASGTTARRTLDFTQYGLSAYRLPSTDTAPVQAFNYGGVAYFTGLHARGALGAETATQTTDVLSALTARGHSGAAYLSSSGIIRFTAAQNFTSVRRGTNIQFWTTGTADSAATTERMRIAYDGSVQIGGTLGTAQTGFNVASDGQTSIYSTYVDVYAPGSSAGFKMYGYGSGVTAYFQGRHARGTLGAETATQAGDTLAALSGLGTYTITGVPSYHTSSSGAVRIQANQNFTSIAAGTKIAFFTTPDASTTLTLGMTLGADQSLAVVGAITSDSTIQAATTLISDAQNVAANVAMRRTGAAGAAVGSGVIVSQLRTEAWNGAAFNTNAFVRGTTSAAQSATEGGGRLQFLTVAVGDATLTAVERMRIHDSGETSIVGGLYIGAAATKPTYGIQLAPTSGDAGTLALQEQASTPTNPTSGVQTLVYMKANKLVLAFNNGGTMAYFYLDLTQAATAAWTNNGTTPP